MNTQYVFRIMIWFMEPLARYLPWAKKPVREETRPVWQRQAVEHHQPVGETVDSLSRMVFPGEQQPFAFDAPGLGTIKFPGKSVIIYDGISNTVDAGKIKGSINGQAAAEVIALADAFSASREAAAAILSEARKRAGTHPRRRLDPMEMDIISQGCQLGVALTGRGEDKGIGRSSIDQQIATASYMARIVAGGYPEVYSIVFSSVNSPHGEIVVPLAFSKAGPGENTVLPITPDDIDILRLVQGMRPR